MVAALRVPPAPSRQRQVGHRHGWRPAFRLAALLALGSCGQASEPVIQQAAPVVVAELGQALDPGSTEAVVVFKAPSKVAAVKRPDPPAKVPRPDPPKPEPPKVVLPSGPSLALQAAMRELEAIRANSSALQAAKLALQAATAELASPGGTISAQLRAAEEQLQATSLAREIEMDQVRKNQCCSVCGSTKTELEKRGKRFLDHLLEVKGTVSRCAPAKLSAVEQKYEGALAAQRAAVASLKGQTGPARAAAQAKVDAAQAKLTEAQRDYDANVRAAEEKVARIGK